ncbi:MAG: TonB-dependent receptor plug domain-containing protein [Colwellia sp.]|nr:TonB-dependent receptor plug domain-containing protein [Colwellia sp.]MCW8865157.1 TonB-dependent receptor plug domain-containing protein [Colwellia sp.]MCW9081939.1 TonB-dependent receptor plug domain-containing protein [Colwellia sp.]
MKLFFKIFLINILSLILSAPVLANDEELDKLFSLTLEQLLHTQVTSSNGIEESLIDAPAAMLIISAKQIEQRGYHNINEILVDLPGFDTINTGGSSNSTTYQRGYRTPFTTRTLFMIDGRVENHLWSQQVLLSRQYPINMISRIEVLYGPASVKYGANAFLGVINIITKNGKEIDDGKNELTLKGEIGSWNSQGLSLFTRGHHGEFSYDISARAFTSDEEDLSDRWGFLSNQLYSDKKIWGPILSLSNDGTSFGQYTDNTDDWGVFAKFRYQNLLFGYNQWQIDEGYGTSFAADKGQNNSDWLRSSQQAFIEHLWQPTTKLTVNSSVNYRHNRVWGNWAEASPDWREGMSEYSFVSFTHWNSSNDAIEAKQDLDYQLSENFRLLSGWRVKRSDLTKSYDVPGYWHAYSSTVPSDEAGPYGFGAGVYHSSDSSYDFSAKPLAQMPDNNREQFSDAGMYGAVIYDSYPWRLNFGLRYDHNQIWETTISPRIAAIYKVNQGETAIKLVYGEAFQEPPAKQLYGGWTDRNANPDLAPEQAKNLELVFMHKTQHWLHDISLYHAQYSEVIREDAINDAKRDSWGVEYRGQFEYNNLISGQEAITGQLFYTYAHTKSNQSYDHQQKQWYAQSTTLGDISPHKINILVNVPVTASFNVNIKANYLHSTQLYARNPLTEQNIDVASRVIFDTAVSYKQAQWQLSFKAMNIFDREVFAPGTGKANSGNDFSQRSLGFNNSLSPQPGRSLWLAVEYTF